MAPLFQLVMRSGPTPGATFSLEGDQLVVGRDSASAIAINDAEVSRKHARLTFQGGKYVIEDLGSTNGTFVNGQRLVSPVVLKSGDVISLGEQIVLMYETLSSDPGATVMSARKSVPRPASVAAPMPAPAQQQFYAPPPPVVPPAAPAAVPIARGTKNTTLYVVIGVLVFLCICAGALYLIDANFLWCPLFGFFFRALGYCA